MIDVETEIREVVRSMGCIILEDTFSAPPGFDNEVFPVRWTPDHMDRVMGPVA